MKRATLFVMGTLLTVLALPLIVLRCVWEWHDAITLKIFDWAASRPTEKPE